MSSERVLRCRPRNRTERREYTATEAKVLDLASTRNSAIFRPKINREEY